MGMNNDNALQNNLSVAQVKMLYTTNNNNNTQNAKACYSNINDFIQWHVCS